MGLRLNRQLGSPACLDVGEFAVDGGETHIRCPLCGGTSIVDDATHTVDRAGKMTPAWACPACPFLEWLELPTPC